MNIIEMLEQLFSAVAKWCSCSEVKTEFKAENEVLKDKKKFQKQIEQLKEDQEAAKKKFKALLIRCIELLKPFSNQFTKQQKRQYRKLLADIRKAVLQ